MNTSAQLSQIIIKWINESDSETNTISIGHERNESAAAIANRVLGDWQDAVSWVRPEGGYISGLVDWPDTAASYLRQARELTNGKPDAWVIIGSKDGTLHLLTRLSTQQNWSAGKTFCVMDINDAIMEHLEQKARLEGLNGMSGDGIKWSIVKGRITGADKK